MTSRFKISSKHDISTLTIHVLICWNKVTLFGQVVPMCERERAHAYYYAKRAYAYALLVRCFVG